MNNISAAVNFNLLQSTQQSTRIQTQHIIYGSARNPFKMPKHSPRSQKKSVEDAEVLIMSAPHTAPGRKIQVSAKTAKVFAKLFDKARQRRVLGWESFKMAMGELGFCVTPEKASRSIFKQPASLGRRGGKSVIVRRPNGGRWDSRGTTRLGGKLAGVFGWNKNTFETASLSTATD
ncbi:hypothetical protein LMH87_005463 [Akanthomyces muscarius]|uniref:Uncharacterized protein n=1 Tax=Akanthomyces muscarius TaxID=2231603 RepID=A0A9W8QLV5_AKAMU|nr:hypothetical protein LMH87_005463 [Akanthomyces muscarius]KAJ4163755.1 hypothetical protein LMH87_005463 [Akanthomyces muscarius]